MPSGNTPYSSNVTNAPSNVPCALVASTTATISTT